MSQIPLKISLTSKPLTTLDLTITFQQHHLSSVSKDEFVNVLLRTRDIANKLKAEAKVARVAFISSGGKYLRLLPLTGLSPDWKPIPNRKVEFNTIYPGYVSSRNGPKLEDSKLDDLWSKFSNAPTKDSKDLTFLGENHNNNLFAKIIRGELPEWRVWESKTHVAFLTPFANTPGFTVLVPRKHLPSEIFSIDSAQYSDLVSAAYDVSQKIKEAFGVKRVGICFEGLEIDYAHVKLIPVYEDPQSESAITGEEPSIISEGWKDGLYPGSVSTQVGPTEIKDVKSDKELHWLS